MRLCTLISRCLSFFTISVLQVVNQNRGGFCLEVNLLLQWLLNEVGFKTEILGGEVKSRITKLFDGTRNEHLVVQVSPGIVRFF